MLFVAVALALGRPWRTSPRAFWTIAALAFLLSLGGLIAPYTGHQAFAYRAATVEWDRPPGVLNDNVNWAPRYSPLHGHWNYARLAATGRITSGRSADTTEPLFGVTVPDELVPMPSRENSGFRHFWWRYVLDYWPDFPSGWIAAGTLGISLLLLTAGSWLLSRWDAACRAFGLREERDGV